MIKILTIIGARPQIIKAAALSRAIKTSFSNQITEIIVHTGQHYDENMSQVFFDELRIPKPNYNLNVGSSNHGIQTAAMIEGIEKILIAENPNYIVLYGDTNSTLAGCIAAAKIHIPIVHIEAGLRSFNKSMPEEINRIMCDHASTLLFSPTQTGINNLVNEGFSNSNEAPYHIDNPKIYHCGDIMLDNSIFFSEIAEQKSKVINDFGIDKNNFILATIHRDNNTDNPERLNSIFYSLNKISSEDKIQIVLPLHPRTSKLLSKNIRPELYNELINNPFIKIIPPASFLDMILLEKNAKLIITDSGGVQKEAFFFKKPCLILRAETEWVEIVNSGSGYICDANEQKILSNYRISINNSFTNFPAIYGDGKTAEFICGEMIKHCKN
ncbi:MAG: UDP-N-acetylglucosamine 2-epimerase (non-hydrolyzing) [Bacteroidetes bacterium]|nr:UDP-N-acetylglucosamine 2-epimerase (non-hydrolyzing) [Bacteroidota bacterium]